MVFGKCSIKILTQFILTTQENDVLRTFFCNVAIDLFKKSILQLAITQYLEFGINLRCEFEIIVIFEWNMV